MNKRLFRLNAATCEPGDVPVEGQMYKVYVLSFSRCLHGLTKDANDRKFFLDANTLQSYRDFSSGSGSESDNATATLYQFAEEVNELMDDISRATDTDVGRAPRVKVVDGRKAGDTNDVSCIVPYT